MTGIVSSNNNSRTSGIIKAAAGGVASGTKMVFHQTAAPTGWTKVTTTGTGSDSINDVGLRIVTGSITDGVGGSVAFDTAFASQTVPAYTLATSEIPAHSHTIRDDSGGSNFLSMDEHYSASSNASTNNTGGGGSHGHGSIDLDVKYIDIIVASKD